MERTFLTVLNMSITASYVILAVILVRLLIRSAPKKYSYLLWSVVGFRLVCPVSFSSVFSLFRLKAFDMTAMQNQGGAHLTYVPENIGLMPIPQVTMGIPAFNEAINASLPAGDGLASINPMQVVLACGTVLWLAGMTLMLLYSLVSYGMLKARMRTAVLFCENVYQSDRVRSPFILGFIRPGIYIPFNLEEQMQQYVLLHERYHLKRRDHLVKLFAFLLLTLHWFNPLCWLAFVLMGKDMEMSCDEKVLCTEKNIRRLYSTALLSFAANRRFPTPGPLAFGEAGVKERIKNVLRWKQPKFFLTAFAAFVSCIVVVACAANPSAKGTIGETGSADTQDMQAPDADDLLSDTTDVDKLLPGTPSDSAVLLVETQDGAREFALGDVALWELDADSCKTGIRLDVDGDGTLEHIYLTSPETPQLEWGHYVIEQDFTLHVENQELEQYGSYVECTILALTLDGQRLLLGIFDEGPSGDPVTTFYRYDGNALYAAGQIPGDIRTLTIGENGVIPCPFRADTIQSSFATGYWYWNGEEVVMREDSEYFYVRYEEEEEFPLTLLESLLVYPQPGDVGEPVVMAPQPVREVKTDLKEGLYLEAQDGTQGWIRAIPSYLPSLGNKQAVEVFEGLKFFD